MKIAIIGTGIAGNTAAYLLAPHYDIKVFEAADYIGGHTHTHQIDYDGENQTIDTGFIVFNHKTYPNFVDLLSQLNVPYQPTSMSFSVKSVSDNIEYNGTTLNQLFAQRSNLFRPRFYRMIAEIMRFNKESLQLLDGEDEITLGSYLEQQGYHYEFIHHYIVPMGAAIWSTDHQSMLQFPARFFVRFFHNHGMLSVNDRPQWYVIKGGSNNYLNAMTSRYRHKIHLNSPVVAIKRESDSVVICAKGHEPERFDAVFIATHSDQALKIIDDPSASEKQVLGAIPYQANEAVLHTDSSLLPKRKRAWAAWNYQSEFNSNFQSSKSSVTLTYNMNILQSLQSDHTFCVTLNQTESVNPDKIIKRIQYAHPFFTVEGVRAQQRQREINGQCRTYFCGAYWRYGFHEDGVVSAQQAVNHFLHDLRNGRLSHNPNRNEVSMCEQEAVNSHA